jgi:hypothetical protein
VKLKNTVNETTRAVERSEPAPATPPAASCLSISFVGSKRRCLATVRGGEEGEGVEGGGEGHSVLLGGVEAVEVEEGMEEGMEEEEEVEEGMEEEEEEEVEEGMEEEEEVERTCVEEVAVVAVGAVVIVKEKALHVI